MDLWLNPPIFSFASPYFLLRLDLVIASEGKNVESRINPKHDSRITAEGKSSHIQLSASRE